MGKKISIEVCLISARGIRRSSSLWKLQWFAVGWIDQDNKYCTKIDASGNANPHWETKFCISVDASESKLHDLILHVEVYCREPVFFRETLEGTATVSLKEFLSRNSEGTNPKAEAGSFQLRKGKTNKPRGFVDVSIQVYEEKEEDPSSSFLGVLGTNEEVGVLGGENGITLDIEHGISQIGINQVHSDTNNSNTLAAGPSYMPTFLQNKGVPPVFGGEGGSDFAFGMGIGAQALSDLQHNVRNVINPLISKR